MQPTHPRPSARCWLRHLGSAATAVALIAAVLTPVAFNPGPADAHPQRVQRCSFDPFAGQQCWYEDVAHTHTPPPTSSTPPGQGHPGGTDNEQDDLPDPPDTTPPGEGHPGGTDNEQDDLPDPPDTTPPGEGHPGGTDNEQDDLPDPPEQDEGEETGDSQTPAGGEEDGAEEEEADTECLSGTFVSGNCQPRTAGEPSGADAEDEEESEEVDTASHIPNDIEIDGQTAADVVGSTEVTFLCQLAENADPDATPNVLRGQRLIEALVEYGVALVCGDGVQSYWHYVLDGDTSPKAFAEFGINVGLEIVCGAITVGTVAATSASGPGAVIAGTAVAVACSNAAGEVAVWIVEGMDYLVQALRACDDIPDDTESQFAAAFDRYSRYALIGRCLVHNDDSDDSESEQQPQQSAARITETPPVCARIDGNWLEVTWNALSPQSMNRLRWWEVSWEVYTRPDSTIQASYDLLATNIRQLRVLKPDWVYSGSLEEADWQIVVTPVSGVGIDASGIQRVTVDGGWAGSNGVGEC